MLRGDMTLLNLSARTYHRVLKVARTITVLGGCEEIGSLYLAEAMHLRQGEVDKGVNYL